MASIVDAIDDVNKDVIQCHFEADETKKAEMKKKLHNFPNFCWKVVQHCSVDERSTGY